MMPTTPPPSDMPKKLNLVYELGRVRAALPWALATLVVVGLAYFTEAHSRIFWSGVALTAVILVMRWAGRTWNHVAMIGLGLGMIPYLAALSAPFLGHRCAVGGCSSLCLPLCTVAGLSAGWLAIKPIMSRKLGLGYGVSALVVVVWVGSLACSCLGVTSTLGAAAGIVMGSAVRAVWIKCRAAC